VSTKSSPLRALVAVAAAASLHAATGVANAQTSTPAPSRTAATAKAAPTAKPRPAPMKVRIVRSAEPGCEPTCTEWISAEGEITAATTAAFRRTLARLGARKLPILIDSPGGEVDPAIAIGRMIRAKGLDVVVTRTVLAPACAPDDAACRKLAASGMVRGRPEAKISKCASSCAFVLAGGVRRYVGAWTVVGLHEIKTISTHRLIRQHFRVVPASPLTGAPARRQVLRQEVLRVEHREGPAGKKTYDRITRYFVGMGVDQRIMPILRAAPNSSIRWVKLDELKSTGLATDFVNGEQLLAPATPPPAATPPSSAADATLAAPAPHMRAERTLPATPIRN
jgi:hypothetical protein